MKLLLPLLLLFVISTSYAKDLSPLRNIESSEHCLSSACFVIDGPHAFSTPEMYDTLKKHPSFRKFNIQVIDPQEYEYLQLYVQYTFLYEYSYLKDGPSDPVRCVGVVVGSALASAGAGAVGGAQVGVSMGGTPTGVAVGATVGAIGGAVAGGVLAYSNSDHCHGRRPGINHGSGHSH